MLRTRHLSPVFDIGLLSHGHHRLRLNNLVDNDWEEDTIALDLGSADAALEEEGGVRACGDLLHHGHYHDLLVVGGGHA